MVPQTTYRLSRERIDRQHSRPRTLLALRVVALVAVGPTLADLASAQTLVPQIPLSTSQHNGAAGFKSAGAFFDLDGASVVYVDPSQITYPTVLPAQTIAGPAGPEAQDS